MTQPEYELFISLMENRRASWYNAYCLDKHQGSYHMYNSVLLADEHEDALYELPLIDFPMLSLLSDEVALHERASEIQRFLNDHAEYPEPPYWFTGDASNHNEGLTYCLDCIKSIKPDAEIGDDYGGGFDCEEDSPAMCEQCGKLLQYTLTDYGVDNELCHHLGFPPSVDRPQDCYELAAVADGVFWNYQYRALVQLYLPI